VGNIGQWVKAWSPINSSSAFTRGQQECGKSVGKLRRAEHPGGNDRARPEGNISSYDFSMDKTSAEPLQKALRAVRRKAGMMLAWIRGGGPNRPYLTVGARRINGQLADQTT
jgi:hypothetical protein